MCVIPAQKKPVLLFTFSLSWLFLAGFILALQHSNSIKEGKTLYVFGRSTVMACNGPRVSIDDGCTYDISMLYTVYDYKTVM